MPDPERDEPEMDVYSGVRWSALSKYGAQGMQVVVSLVLARLLAPEYFGLLAMATVVTGFVNVFKNLGFASAIIQRKTIDARLLSTLFWVNLGMCLLVTGVLVGISPAAAWVYDDPRVAPIVAVLSINFLLAGFTMIPTAVLTRRMAFNKLAVREIAAVIVGGTTSITLAAFGWGVWALVAGSLADSAAQMVLINLLSPFRPRLVFDGQGLRECLGFGLNLTGFNIFNYFARNADNFIIGIFLGPVALGYYALAYKLMLLPRDAVTNVVTRVLFPAFSRMQGDDERLANAYLRTCGAIAFVTFPMMAGLAVIARPFVEVVLGDKWLPAVPLIWILAPVGMLQSVWSTAGQIFLAKGRADWQFRWGVLAGLIIVGSFVLGLPWGVVGVASAYALACFALAIPGFYLPFSLVGGLRIRHLVRTLLPYGFSASAMALLVGTSQYVLERLGLAPTAFLALSVALGMFTYFFLTLWIRPPAVADLSKLLPANWSAIGGRTASRQARSIDISAQRAGTSSAQPRT